MATDKAPIKKSLSSDKPPFSLFPRPENIHAIRDFAPPPDDELCFQLWDQYAMLNNVREHSLRVAHVAGTLAALGEAQGLAVNAARVRASALLHDLAKTYCLQYGGSHALLGASWTLQETGEADIAQGVLLHVYWPWQLPEGALICCLPILVLYADKRVKHAECVSINQRFEDLLIRYGKTEDAKEGIRNSWQQTKIIERRLSAQLGIDLDEYSFDCGRLVN